VVVQPTKEVVFKQSVSGLYYNDTEDRAVLMVSTVKENRDGYTRRELVGAKEAR
jgi:hypothetical protein